MPLDRDVGAAARRLADHHTRRLRDAGGSGQVVATVAAVTAGAASDGNALVKVTYRGATLTCTGGYNRAYTPVVGHRVVCDWISGQLTIAYSPIGQP